MEATAAAAARLPCSMAEARRLLEVEDDDPRAPPTELDVDDDDEVVDGGGGGVALGTAKVDVGGT